MKTSVRSRAEWDTDLPLVVFPVHNHPAPETHAASLRACAARYLPRAGSMLFRGFRILHRDAFVRFAAAFGASVALVTAEASQREPTRGRLWVACTGSADGATLADNREIAGQLSVAARKSLLERGMREADFGALLRQPDPSLEPGVLAEIAAAYEACAIHLEWEAGDVLLLDRPRMSLSVPAGAGPQLAFAVDQTRALTAIS